jgi:glycosyltransferase involved in cell wall biosynthesis
MALREREGSQLDDLKRGRLLYVSFEAMDPDRAAYTHVTGLIGGLERCGWNVKLVAAPETRLRGGGSARRLWRYLQVNLRAIMALGRADALYVRSHFAGWLLAQAARLLGAPTFQEINGVPDDVVITYRAMRPFRPLLRWFYRSQFRCATRLFVVTDGLADYFRAFAGHERISVTPNGVDPAMFGAGDALRPAAAPAGEYALFYGDLARWHGLDLMLAAARDAAWPAHLRLLVIGRGSAADSLKIPADLSSRIVWLDRMPQRALRPFIVHARMGLAPITDPGGRSRTGVIPLKVIEMMACAAPVIVTDLPGQADLVREAACGIVIPTDDAHAMALAVAALASSPDAAAMGRRGRAAVETRYTWEAIARRVDAAIGHLRSAQ